MKTVEPLRSKQKVTEILDDLEYCDTWHEQRMYLLFATMLYTGLRVSDVVKLRKCHVYKVDYLITTEKKTGKPTKIMLPPELRSIYEVRLKDLSDNDYLFTSRKSYPDGAQRHITTRTAGNDLKLIKERYGIKTPFACHSMRKTYGYFRYKNGASLEALRQQFNHADEATTRRYIGIDTEERNKDIIKLNFNHTPTGKPRKPYNCGKAGKPLEISRHDREKQGRTWGQKKKAAARKKAGKK